MQNQWLGPYRCAIAINMGQIWTEILEYSNSKNQCLNINDNNEIRRRRQPKSERITSNTSQRSNKNNSWTEKNINQHRWTQNNATYLIKSGKKIACWRETMMNRKLQFPWNCECNVLSEIKIMTIELNSRRKQKKITINDWTINDYRCHCFFARMWSKNNINALWISMWFDQPLLQTFDAFIFHIKLNALNSSK